MRFADLKAEWARQLNALWYDASRRPTRILRGLATVYAALLALRKAGYRIGWLPRHRIAMPVIVVGNLSVGGTGKTPVTLALIEALRQRGWRPGVISRGYGGSTREASRVQSNTPASVCGDEPKLLFERSGAPLAVARRRSDAARLLQSSGDVDVLVADDGLQHLALARDIEIVVIDGQRRFGNQLLLPAGPLREPLERLRTVDWCICNGGEPQGDEIAMTLRLGEPRALLEPTRRIAFARQRVHAVAGIGDPTRFFASLHRLGVTIIAHPFADHHDYRPEDLMFADDLPVWMTEKDAVKCRAFAQPHWYSVPVDAELPAHFFDAIDQRLRSLTRDPA